MTMQIETATLTSAEAYAKAVDYATQADYWADQGLDDRFARNAASLAAVSQAFAAIAQIAATNEQTTAIIQAHNGSRAY